MSDETFRSRLLKLVQKGRKALRLYSSMGKKSLRSDDLSDVQVYEWREVNADLLRQLSSIVENANPKKMVNEVYSLRDRFYNDWRMSESEMHQKHKQLLYVSEQADFVRAANLAKELASLKARVQALQAVHHEVQEVINQSQLQQPAIALREVDVEYQAESSEKSQEKQANPILRQAKVIPLRKQIRQA